MSAPPAASKQPTTEQTINLKVYSPFKVYYEDDVYSVSAVNDTGPFDILPHHHPFITLLNACSLQIASVRGQQLIDIDGGLMHVRADKVVVFLNV